MNARAFLVLLTACLLASVAIASDETSILIDQLSHEDWGVREESCRALAELRDPSSVEALSRALGDERGEVRRDAARALGLIGDARAVDDLIEALGKSTKRFEAESMIRALAELGDPRAIDAIVAALGRDEPEVEGYSVREIWKFRDPRINKALMGMARHETGALDYNVVSALVNVREPGLVEPLLEEVRDGGSRKAWRAASALGELGDARAVEPLIRALGSSNESLQNYAARALANLGATEALDPLTELAANGRLPYPPRVGATFALGRLGGEEQLVPLRKLAKESDHRITGAAREAIGDIELGAYHAWRASGEDAAIRVAREALKDGEINERLSAVRLLREMASEAACDALIEAMADLDNLVAEMALIAAAQFENERATVALIGALRDGNESVCVRAMRAVDSRRDPRAIEPIARIAESKNERLREQAAEALGRIGSAQATATLCWLLDDKEPAVRQAAARSLGRCADDSALESALKALERELILSTRVALIRALGRIRHPHAIAKLEDSLRESDPSITSAAARSLARLGWTAPDIDLRTRYFVALGRELEAPDLFPQAMPAGDVANRLEGAFMIDRPVLTPLSIGVDEWEQVVMLHRIEFREQDGKLQAIVHMNSYTWPKSTWRVIIELIDESRFVVAAADFTHETAGVIISKRMLVQIEPETIDFGKVKGLDTVKRFAVSIVRVE